VSEKKEPTLFTFVGMGVTTALCIAVGLGGGYLLDDHFHSGPALTFAGLALGLVAAVAATWLKIRSFL
jgi:F0F1-type ATP synthase assembly protein I